MKRIKIILVIISVLVVIFFATGSFIKETSYTASIKINKPLESVFKEFNDMENTKKWIPEIKSIDTISSNYAITGSVFKIAIDNQGETINMTEKVVAYIPNEKVTLFYDAENMLKTNDYIFSEENGVTNIVLNATCSSDSYILSCLFPYFKGTFRNQDQQYLTNFKEFLENGSVK